MEGKGPLSFDQILSDPVNLNYFKQFCAPRVHTSCLAMRSQALDSRPQRCHPMPRFPPEAVGPRRFGRPQSGDPLQIPLRREGSHPPARDPFASLVRRGHTRFSLTGAACGHTQAWRRCRWRTCSSGSSARSTARSRRPNPNPNPSPNPNPNPDPDPRRARAVRRAARRRAWLAFGAPRRPCSRRARSSSSASRSCCTMT